MKEKVVRLVLPVPTSVNKLYHVAYRYNAKTGEMSPTSQIIMSKEGKKMKARLIGEAQKQMKSQKANWNIDDSLERFINQEIEIVFARRGSDGNNIFKLLNDSMEGIIYHNDSKVKDIVKKITYNPKNPRLIVTYTVSDQIGIFDNESQLNEFEERCKDCSRYRNGKCRILQDSKEGTEREEATQFDCFSFKERA